MGSNHCCVFFLRAANFFLGSGFKFGDFLADGFGINKHAKLKRLGLMAMTFVPPMAVAAVLN